MSCSVNEPLVQKRRLGHQTLGVQLLKSTSWEEIPTSASELFLFLGLPLVTLRPPREDFVVVFTESSASTSRVVSKTELLALSIREDISDSFTWNKIHTSDFYATKNIVVLLASVSYRWQAKYRRFKTPSHNWNTYIACWRLWHMSL